MMTSVRELFTPARGMIYLDAATYGLPPRPAMEAYQNAIERWATGEARWLEEWEPEGERCRELFAALIGADSSTIALQPSVSAGVAPVGASLPEGAEVLLVEDEFTSLRLPLLAFAEKRRLQIRDVSFEALAEAVRPSTHLVAFSLTRAQDGRTADLGAIVEATGQAGTRVVVDATHALPWVPVEPYLDGIDVLLCHGYKHLLLPRGVSFAYLNPRIWSNLPPVMANWRSVGGRSYGGVIPAPETAAAFDVSLAWHAWVGARPALELLVEWRRDGTLEEPLRLAEALAEELGVPPGGAAIVAVRVPDPERAAASLAEAGVRCAARGEYVRLSTHVWNTRAEVELAAAAVRRAMG